MKNPKISVIVPVYNVEKYLRKCLDTIISQTFADIEIICVNDGSTDNSRNILEEYKNKDCRIVIVDKKNGGLSSARNAGMKVARGEFISFIDSDDWIDETMLEKLYNSMTTLNTDITICAVHQFDETKQVIDDSNPYYTLGFFDESFTNKAFSYKETKPFLMDVCVMAWNKLYRKSLIDECQAQFPEGLIFEDGPFFFTIFFKTQRVSIVRDFLYYYRINRSGSIIQKAGKKFLDIIDVVELMYDKIKQIPDFEDVKYLFFRKKIEDFIYRFENMNPKYRLSFARKLRDHSNFSKDAVFPDNMVVDSFTYNYLLFSTLKTGKIPSYEMQKFKQNLMYKVMEIMYKQEGIYYFKCKNFIFKLKKRPKLYDFYYYNDRIYIILLSVIKFDFEFKYSELEKSNKND